MESLRREKLKQIGVLDVYLDAQPRSGGSEREGRPGSSGVRRLMILLLVEKADHQLNDLGVEDVNGLENQNRIEIELEPEPATGAQTATATATATG
ncbi:hypothetical protein KEM48_007043, partial [Puccinia striiformis f. sp. tritici PST-130]